MSPSLLYLRKPLHTQKATSTLTSQKPNQAAGGVGSLVCSAATQKKKPSPPSATKSQANAVSAVMAATPMVEVAAVVAVAEVVTAPNAAIVQNAVPKAAMQRAATSATPKALRPVANARHAAKVAVHAKTATAAAVVNHAMPKAKPPSTTTPHRKPKPKPALKRATNAWPAKSVARAVILANNANLAVSAQNVVKVAKGVVNAAHVVNATKVAVNGPHVWTRTATQKSCPSTTQQPLKAKYRKPTRTVASVVSAAHATATAVTAASVATAHRVKKVPQNTSTTANLLSTTMQRMTTLHTSKSHKKHVSHANRVNHASNANLAVSVKSAHHVTHRVMRHHKLHLQPKRLPAPECHAFKRSHCLWPTCKPWPKAVVWNGSTPTQNASPPCKPLLQPSPNPCMCHASVHLW